MRIMKKDTSQNKAVYHWEEIALNHLGNPLLIINEDGFLVYTNLAAHKKLKLPYIKNDPVELDEYIDCHPLVGFINKIVWGVMKKQLPHFQEIEVGDKIYTFTINTIQIEHKTIGASVVIADVTNTRLQERENTLFYHIASITASFVPFEEALQKILYKVQDIMGVPCTEIILRQNSDDRLIRIACTDKTQPGRLGVKLGEGIVGWVCQTGQPLAVPHTKAEKRYLETRSGEQDRSLLAVPLVAKGRVLGAINLFKEAGQYFTESQVQTYSAIASRIADVLDNERLRRIRKNRNQLAKILDSSLELEPTLSKGVFKIAEIIESEGCAIFLWDKDREQLEGFASTHHSQEEIMQVKIQLGENRLKQTFFEAGNTFFLDGWKRFPWIRSLIRQTGWQKSLAVALVSRGEPQGLILIHNPQCSSRLANEEISLAGSVGGDLAVVIDNGRLYERINQERNLLNTIQKTTNEGLVFNDSKGGVIFANQRAKELLGIRQSILGKSIFEFVSNPEQYSRYQFDFPESIEMLIRRAIKDGKPFSVKFRTVGFPKKILWAELKPVKDEKGVAGALVAIRDFTEIQELQEKMAARVHQLSHLYRISSVSATDFKQIIRRIVKIIPHVLGAESSVFFLYNPTDERLTMFPSDGGRRTQSIPEQQSKLWLWVKNNCRPLVFPQKDVLKESMPNFLDDTESLLAVPVIDGGECIGMLAVTNKTNHDIFTVEDLRLLSIIASQIAAEIENDRLISQIANEREQLSLIISNSAGGIMVVDADNRIRIWNKALEQLTGYREDEVINKTIDQVLVTNDKQPLSRVFKRQVDDKTYSSEIQIRTRERRYCWVTVRYSPLHGINHQEAKAVILINDVTYYKELEQTKNEFISMATHELRTPLTVIKGYLSMIMHGDAGPLTKKQENFFQRVLLSSDRLSGLVEDLLNVMRLEEKRMTFNIKLVNMSTLIKETAADFQKKANDEKISLEIQELEEENIVRGDPDRIKQILANLIDNALKYTPDGGKVWLEVNIEKNKGQLYLITTVHDNGIGIPREHLTNVFNRFQRIDNPLSKQVGGTGLGLYITKSLVEQQGGKIWVSSAPHKGSRFAFSLPLVQLGDNNDNQERSFCG